MIGSHLRYAHFRLDDNRLYVHGVAEVSIERVWERIKLHAGAEFTTKTGLPFTYEVPGNYLRVNRANRSLSRTNFQKALAAMPVEGPGAIKDRQGSAYTWAILMDSRIRSGDW